jgi:hypothetical protein
MISGESLTTISIVCVSYKRRDRESIVCVIVIGCLGHEFTNLNDVGRSTLRLSWSSIFSKFSAIIQTSMYWTLYTLSIQ